MAAAEGDTAAVAVTAAEGDTVAVAVAVTAVVTAVMGEEVTEEVVMDESDARRMTRTMPHELVAYYRHFKWFFFSISCHFLCQICF